MFHNYNEKLLIKDNFNHGKEKILCYLLSRLFECRYYAGKNDSAFFQDLVDSDRLTINEIRKHDEAEEYRPCGPEISPVYANIIYKVSKKAASDVTFNIIVEDYLARQYLRKEHYNNGKITEKGGRKLRAEANKLKKGLLPEELALYYASLGLFCDAIDTDELCCMGYKQGWMNRMFYKDEKGCEKLLSVYLSCDVRNHTRLVERFCSRRINELFNYICSLCSANPDSFSQTEKVSVIIGAACGFVQKPDIKALDANLNKLEKENIINKHDKIFAANTFTQYLYPTKKVRSPMISDCNLQFMHADFAEAFQFSLLLNGYLEEGLFREAVFSAILDYLVEKVVACQDSGEEVTIEQIIRKFPYDESDCRVVLEKINCVVNYSALAKYHDDIVKLSIDNFNYFDIEAATKFSSFCVDNDNNDVKQDKYAQKQIKKITEEKEAALSSVGILQNENDSLKEENHRLINKIAKISNQYAAIESLKDENTNLKREVEELQNKIEAMKEAHASSDELALSPVEQNNDESEDELPDELFKDMRFIIVGGRYEVNRRLIEFMPKTRVVYEAKSEILNSNNYDAVLFFTEFVSHKLFKQYADQCRTKGTPFAFMKGSSIKLIKKDIFEFAQRLSIKTK